LNWNYTIESAVSVDDLQRARDPKLEVRLTYSELRNDLQIEGAYITFQLWGRKDDNLLQVVELTNGGKREISAKTLQDESGDVVPFTENLKEAKQSKFRSIEKITMQIKTTFHNMTRAAQDNLIIYLPRTTPD
jgi:hypothetical protein